VRDDNDFCFTVVVINLPDARPWVILLRQKVFGSAGWRAERVEFEFLGDNQVESIAEHAAGR
jgi:hypothetical protein